MVSLDQAEELVRGLVARGGPTPSDDAGLEALLRDAFGGLHHLRRAFGEALSMQTLQGFALHKPHGYAGDYEIIDHIYRGHTTADPHLSNWDRFFQDCGAARAVRNRKAYFHALLRSALASAAGTLRVLNVASGPGRDVWEFFSGGPADVIFDCVERDPDAIAYAHGLCSAYAGRIRFNEASVLTFRAEPGYGLVWSAGLFDYFDDRIFRRVLTRLLPAVAPGGELVIGNFSVANPSAPYMHLLDWDLRYRSADDLRALARQCGVPNGRIRIGHEPLGINLFLHITG
jgi:extracellular factor (EF) 3-hydroxypalmitic acid methyl ester biosynthesis protein